MHTIMKFPIWKRLLARSHHRDGSDKSSGRTGNSILDDESDQVPIDKIDDLPKFYRNSGYYGGASDPKKHREKAARRSNFALNDADRHEADMQERDNRAVLRIRVIFVAILVISAAAVAGLTFHFTRRFEKDLFQHQYESAALLLLESFQAGVSRKVFAAKTFSAIYTSRYGPKNPWPNVTMPDFQQQAKGQLQLSSGRAISFNPLITNGTMRDRWEAHAAANAWVLQSEQLINRSEGKRIVADGIFRVVTGSRMDDPGGVNGSYPSVLVPVWQIAPILTNEAAVMFNLKSVDNRQRALDDMMEYNITVLTDLLQLVQDPETRPSSILFFPVFDKFNEKFNNTGERRRVVGSISVVFSWDDVFRGSLPSNVRGIVCVLETNFGKSFTFSVSGGAATLLGEGDLHEVKYDKFVHSVQASLEETQDDLGVADDLAVYRVRTYPSTELEGVYVTVMPEVYAAVVLVIFVATSAIFLLYDYLAKRHTMQMKKAADMNDKVVDSLFPKFMKHRIIYHVNKELEQSAQDSKSKKSVVDEHEEGGSGFGDEGAGSASGGSGAARLACVLKVMNPQRKFGRDADDSEYSPDKHIADYFPSTTVFFADLAGFTSWSAGRPPEHVFLLLERLFTDFDSIAIKFGVYKVETIGDCYTAVTGLPDPQEDHAVRMCEFAMACRDRFVALRVKLEPEFKDLNRLNIRIGCHSGGVTAGVLRGQKARFQLFGKTVYTASQMEATGKKGRIHISETTANRLVEAGKEDWLTRRKDQVVQLFHTYWVDRDGFCPSGKETSGCSDTTTSIRVSREAEAEADADADADADAESAHPVPQCVIDNRGDKKEKKVNFRNRLSMVEAPVVDREDFGSRKMSTGTECFERETLIAVYDGPDEQECAEGENLQASPGTRSSELEEGRAAFYMEHHSNEDNGDAIEVVGDELREVKILR